MAAVRRMVLDILKPHEPSMTEVTERLADLEGVEGVNSSLIEVDEEVRNIKVTLEGEIDTGRVRELIEDTGGSIHSVDEVAAGEQLVDKIETPQD